MPYDALVAQTHTPEQRERQRESQRRYEARNRDKRREKNRRYREANREACRARTLANYYAKREKHLETQRAYRLANPSYMAERTATRKAATLAVTVERVYRSVVWRRDAGVCGICGLMADPADWHLDHVIALVNGGEHSYANVQVAHPRCNLVKGARDAV